MQPTLPGQVFRKHQSRVLEIRVLLVMYLDRINAGETWIGCPVFQDGTIGKPMRISLTADDTFLFMARIPASALEYAERVREAIARRQELERQDDGCDTNWRDGNNNIGHDYQMYG